MIIRKAEKPKTYRNNLRRLFIFFFLFAFWSGFSQKDVKGSQKKLKKIGVLYNSAKQNNILFFDKDYDYKTNALKVQLFYHLRKGKKWDMNLIVQPQFQIANHQLLNRFFVTPDKPYFQELDRLVQKRTISLYVFELGFQLRRKLFHQVYFETTLGLGAGYIDKGTERLAQGFTFIENLSVGLAHTWFHNEIYIGANVGHVSNFNIQLPNSGYNIFGFEVGYRMFIN